ncbi:eukaryotic translation initiation factor [Phytophthora cinnamomi]|uniref:eukaryotic translation initiation factor n=1 Tax=Phytophthora cinnamomi TaxID=4785 RepID=UPI00355A0AB8|nr:eukaryotic translation initiation factor [Phytophthora cinnamomi]
MGDEFYTSSYDKNDTSTTIIFNVFRGSPHALKLQLEAALNQENVTPPHVWVMSFNSPNENAYRDVVESMRLQYPGRSGQLVMTVSNYNHKFHGRFLLAYMATTKYVLVVDDDRNIDSTTVHDYIQYMNLQKGVWGNFGHLRAPTFAGYKSWPNVGYDLGAIDWVEQDYLCGMWFLEQTWLEYFAKERPPSWETAEDMHLSHVMRKYLNLNTYGGKVALEARELPRKDYAATVGSALDLREYIFDHQLGRGNKVANVEQPLDSLVYAESASDIEEFIEKLDACPTATSDTPEVAPWCEAGKTAAVFRGAKDQDVVGLILAAKQLCNRTNCEYYSAKPNIKHPIHYFNMREGYGQANTGVEIPFQTGATDVILSLVGILNNVLPRTLYLFSPEGITVADVDKSVDPDKRNALQIYHRTALLSVDIHRNSKTNPKWFQRPDVAGSTAATAQKHPNEMRTFVWQRENDRVTAY